MSDSESTQTSVEDGVEDEELAAYGRQRSNSAPGGDHPLVSLHGVKSLSMRRGSATGTLHSKKTKEQVKVLLRIRPQNNEEIKRGGNNVLTVREDNKKATLTVPSGSLVGKDGDKQDYTFGYDTVFNETARQRDVSDYILDPLLNDLFEGFNASIIAYGQTGSGKTHTMMGSSTDPGVIPAALIKIFARVAAAPVTQQHRVMISCVELYKERLQDLLDPATMKRAGWGGGAAHDSDLPAGPDLQQTDALTFIANVTQVEVDNATSAVTTIHRGMQNRVTAETKSNTTSSRSHAVILLTLEAKDLSAKVMRRGQLFLVDLAGSEKVAKAETEGLRLQEAKMINLSLFALRQVVTALCVKKRRKGSSHHIPYRDSKLTRLLENSLGGNARSAFIITVSPSSYNVEETLSSMRFGEHSRKLTTKPRKHKMQTVEELQYLLTKTREELDLAKNMIRALTTQNDILLQCQPSQGGGPLVAARHSDPQVGLMLQAQLMCPLSKGTMSHPVVCMDGYTYEKQSILLWVAQHGNLSPSTGAPMNASLMIPNLLARNLTSSCLEKELFFKRNTQTLLIGDIMESIFLFCDPPRLVRCLRVCTLWNRLGGRSELWERHIAVLRKASVPLPADLELLRQNFPPFMVYFTILKRKDVTQLMHRGLEGGMEATKTAVGIYQKGHRRPLQW